jgi:hypothetical protein
MCRKNPEERKAVLCEFVSWAQSLEAICLLHFVNGSACSLLDFMSLSNPGGFCNYRGIVKQDDIAYIVVNLPLNLCMLQAMNHLSQYKQRLVDNKQPLADPLFNS